MSNVNVGGVEAGLVLNIREWNRPAQEALKVIRETSQATNRAMADVLRSTTTGFGGGGKAAKEFGAEVTKTSATTRDRLREAGGAVQKFGSDVRGTFQSNLATFQKFRSDWNGTMLNMRETMRDVSGMLGNMSQTARAAMASMGREFVSFNQQMRDFNAIAKLSEPELAKVTDEVKRMTTEMNLTQGPVKLADALKEISGAGWDGVDAMKVLRAAARGADAGDTDTRTFAAGINPVLRSYGLGADSSNLVTDQMFAAMDQGNLRAEELARGIGQVVPIAGQAGVSLQELMGSLASMSLNGKSASENFTSYRAALQHILAPAADAKKILRDYGVEAGESAIRTKGLVGVIKDLYSKSGGNLEVIKKVLDDEGMQAAAALVKMDRGATTDRMVKAQFSADGSTDAARQQRMKGYQVQLEQLNAAWQAFKDDMMSGLEPVLTKGLQGMQRLMSTLSTLPNSTKAAIGGFAGLTTAVGTLTAGGVLLAPTLIQVGTWVTGFGGVGKVAAASAGLLSSQLAGLAGMVSALAVPLAALVGTTALVATAWRNDWGGIRDYTATVMADLRDTTQQGMAALDAAVGPTVRAMVANFQESWPVLREFTVWVAEGFVENTVAHLKRWSGAWRGAWGAAQGYLKIAWGAMEPVLSTIEDGLNAVGAVAITVIEGNWKQAWELAVTFVNSAGERIGRAFDQIKANVLKGFNDLGRQAYQAFFGGFEDDNGWKPVIARADGAFSQFVGTLDHGIDKFNQLAEAGEKAFLDITRTARTQPVLFSGLNAAAMARHHLQGGPSSQDQIGGGKEGVAPPDMPDLSRSQAKKAQVSRAQMEAYIRANAGVYGDVGGLDTETLRATYKLIQNSVLADFKLQITSGKRHGHGGSFHNSGRAVDIQAMGRANNLDDPQVPEMIRRLAQGTGFRSGINEYRRDALRVTGGTGPHMHLTTGLERVGKGAVPGAFLLGGQGSLVSALQAHQKDFEAAKKLLGQYLSKPVNEFQAARIKLAKEYVAARQAAQETGAGASTIAAITAAHQRRISEVNAAEQRETAKTVNDLTIMRLEAEGKMGEAAKARIAATAQQERERLNEMLKGFPQLQAQIDKALEAVNANEQRQLASQQLEVAVGQVGDRRAAGEFKSQDPGMANLMAQFPEFRAQIEQAYAAIQAYIQDPSEATRARFQESVGLIQQMSGTLQEQQQKKLEAIEWERQMGQITTEEALARQGEVLNNWVGGEDQKRAMKLQQVDAWRQHFETQLELQGEFNLKTLEQFRESLLAQGELTSAQQTQLAAASQVLQKSRIAEQQQWGQMMQQMSGNFEGFLTNVMTGNQTFKKSFEQLWKSISQLVINEIAKMIVKALALKAIMKSIGGFFGFHDGGWVEGDVVPPDEFHSGGWVGGRRLPSFHSGGWVGSRLRSDETLAKLQTGEFVLSRRHIAGLAEVQTESGAPQVVNHITVNATIHREADVEQLGAQLGRSIRRQLAGGL